MVPILKSLEPFAMDLWNKEITDWLPASVRPAHIDKQTFFAGCIRRWSSPDEVGLGGGADTIFSRPLHEGVDHGERHRPGSAHRRWV